MSEIGKKLTQTAIQIANDFAHRKNALQQEKLSIEEKLQEVEAHREAAGLAVQRGFNFQPTIGGELQCPRCWIAQGRNTPLIPKPSDDPGTDLFGCRECGSQYAFDA